MRFFPTGPPILFLFLGAMFACTGDSTHPIAIESENGDLLSPEASAPAPKTLTVPDEVANSFSMTALELLSDQFLRFMTGSLEDGEKGGEISSAIEEMRAGLLAKDRKAAKAAYVDALSTLRAYAKAPAVSDDDVIHVDAITLTLDEVERLMESVEQKPAKR